MPSSSSLSCPNQALSLYERPGRVHSWSRKREVGTSGEVLSAAPPQTPRVWSRHYLAAFWRAVGGRETRLRQLDPAFLQFLAFPLSLFLNSYCHRLFLSSLRYVRYGLILEAIELNPLLTPLTPAVFYILLALASGDKHGYKIMKQGSQDGVKMGTGTLYGSLKRMLAGLIEAAGDRPDPAQDDERRRHYRLIDLGQRALDAELRRYASAVSSARQRRLLPQLSLDATR